MLPTSGLGTHRGCVPLPYPSATAFGSELNRALKESLVDPLAHLDAVTLRGGKGAPGRIQCALPWAMSGTRAGRHRLTHAVRLRQPLNAMNSASRASTKITG